MALDERAQAELRAIFQEELRDHCQVLSHAFLALEKEPDASEQHQLLGEVFRAAHSLKGAARAVGIGPIEVLAHALEEVLAELQQDKLQLSPPLFDLLYAVVDAFGTLGDDPGPTVSSDAPVEELLRQLETARARLPGEDVTVQHRDLPLADSAEPKSVTAMAAPGAATIDERSIASGERSSRSGAAETVRLPAERLDKLLEQLGELVIPRLELMDGLSALADVRNDVEEWMRDWRKARSHLRQLDRDGLLDDIQPLVRFLERNETGLASLASQLAHLDSRLASSLVQLGGLTDNLQDDVKRLRMLPFGSIASSFERVVRDLARSLGKDARLVLTGTDTELDRRMLDEMRDALLHLLRNAVDHGIEDAHERQRLGKPATGSISLAAYHRGGTVVIEVEDDGTGLDAGVIRSTAEDLRLVTATDLATLPDAEIQRLIFLPGLSTSEQVSRVSGRGVGLDIVARTVEHLGGQIDVNATMGRGTCFRITLPLTLATTRALLVEAGGLPYALHTSVVQRVVRASLLQNVGGRLMLEHEGVAVPIFVLSDLLSGRTDQVVLEPGEPRVVALVGSGAQRMGLVIDQIVGEQEIVVKPLSYPLLRVRYIAGATILGSGQVVPILNVGDLTRSATKITAVARTPQTTTVEHRRLRVLVADDSLTTRTLERYILEAAGYEVELAGDGVEALSVLDQRGCDVLVSDVDMPGLDGVALTAQIRQVPRYRELPIILVTSLASPEDRERGLQAGADAYMVKSSFDQDQLLRTIQELV